MKKRKYIARLAAGLFFLLLTLSVILSFPPALQAGWADDVKWELWWLQGNPAAANVDSAADSDYESIDDDGAETEGLTGEDEDADPSPDQAEARTPHRPAAGTAARLFYDRLVYIFGNLRDTEYVHASGRTMDEDEGVYKYDCSGFVGDFILKAVLPDHYQDLVDNTKRFHPDSHPRAWGFYDYFREILGDKAENSNQYWQVFRAYENLRPGDIIIAKYDEDWRQDTISRCGKASTGHVMVAWSFPVQSTVNDNEFWIQIIDSSSSGHGSDTRRSTYDGISAADGIGKGKMWYGYNSRTAADGTSYNRPIYYRWSKVHGCKYTLVEMTTNCAGDHYCQCDGCSYKPEYYQRLQGIIMARPIFGP